MGKIKVYKETHGTFNARKPIDESNEMDQRGNQGIKFRYFQGYHTGKIYLTGLMAIPAACRLLHTVPGVRSERVRATTTRRVLIKVRYR